MAEQLQLDTDMLLRKVIEGAIRSWAIDGMTIADLTRGIIQQVQAAERRELGEWLNRECPHHQPNSIKRRACPMCIHELSKALLRGEQPGGEGC